MDRTPTASRDRDPIEAVLYFLFKNWILLVTLPVVAGLGALLVTLFLPPQSVASLRIPSPPVPTAAFDNLWSSPDNQEGATVSVDGSVIIRRAGSNDDDMRSQLEAVRADVLVIAYNAVRMAEKRHAALSEMEAKLLTQTTDDSKDTLATRAAAIVGVIVAAEEATKKVRLLKQWTQHVNAEKIEVSRGTSFAVLFTVFSAFTLALLIAIVRLLSRRSTSR